MARLTLITSFLFALLTATNGMADTFSRPNYGAVVRSAQYLANTASNLAYSLDRIHGCTPGLRSSAQQLVYVARNLADAARYSRNGISYEYAAVNSAFNQLKRQISREYYLDYQIERNFEFVARAKYDLDDAIRYSNSYPGRGDNCRYVGGREVCTGVSGGRR